MQKSARALFVPALLAATLIISGAEVGSPTDSHVDPHLYLDDVKYLASPTLKGRATGSPGLEKAASFIEGRFKSFGLKPITGSSYELAFPAEIGTHLGSGNAFTEDSQSLKEGRDYEPFAFSTNGKFQGGVVFAGYGITAKEYNYDDYAGLDVTDKVVLVLRHEPQESDDKSIFAGKKLTTHATFTDKMVNAKRHGARGVILINDLPAHPATQDKLEKFGAIDGPRDAGIFFVQMKEAIAEQWFKEEGRDLNQTAAAIDRDLKPQSFAFGHLKINLAVNVVRDTKTVHNVAAFLPGTTPEYIVVGAHYDHLGLGDSHSLAPSQLGTIHPGADDNASGTAGVIELARYFAKQPPHKRGILFVTFAGEELGLLGSNWFVNHPDLPAPNAVAMINNAVAMINNAVAMINMDMIGRIRDGRVFVSGGETSAMFAKLLDDEKPPAPLHIDLSGKDSGTDMSGASDHASFVAKQIPILFFFSGLHGDYHKPSDTADKIDSVDAAKLLDYVAVLTTRIADAPERPVFIKPVRHTGNLGSNSTQSGYGPDFGSIPDFNEPPKGVRFADIREGSPAAKAGLKPGDILIEFGGKEIGNLYDFTYALRDHAPGDTVLVKVLRGNETIEAKVMLTERR